MRVIFLFCLLVATAVVMAAPSTVVWMPSTDTQMEKTWHANQAAFIARDESQTIVDTALSYGVSSRVEVGVDVFSPFAQPFAVNAKVLLTKPGEADVPVAVGVFNVGASSSPVDYRVAYAVASKGDIVNGRVTVGGYTAKAGAVGDDHTGVMLGAEFIKERWWYGADYLSGDNALGSVNVAACYSFSPTNGVLIGYSKYNSDGVPDVCTIQFGAYFQ
jgi:hypothetical protein